MYPREMRTDSELLIFTFRSEKRMDLLTAIIIEELFFPYL